MPSTGNPWVDLFLLLFTVLLGGSGGGAVVALRKDRRDAAAAHAKLEADKAAGEREGRTTEVSLTETLQRIAETALERQEDRHAEERETWRHERGELVERVRALEDRDTVLTARVKQLEKALEDAHVPVPRPLRIVREG